MLFIIKNVKGSIPWTHKFIFPLVMDNLFEDLGFGFLYDILNYIIG